MDSRPFRLISVSNRFHNLGMPNTYLQDQLMESPRPPSQDLHADVQNSQLLILLEQARYDQAEALARKSLEYSPADGQAHHVLGAILLNNGSFAQAVHHLEEATRLLPQDAQVWNNLANAQQRLGQRQAALASYQHALTINPDFAVALHNLGVVLQELGHHVEAAACLQRALSLAPDYADAHFNLGLAEISLNRLEQASANFHSALSINPHHTHALVALGNAAANSGQFDKAEDFYLQALRIEPSNLAAWSAIPEIRTMTKGDVVWLQAAENMPVQQMSVREQSRFHFSLGKYFNDLKEFDMAFDHYRQANELSKLIEAPYDPATQTAWVDRVCNTFDLVRATRLCPSASHSTRPVFIFGMPRSGTSLAEQIVASHPDVVGGGELNFWHNALRRFMPANPADEFDAALIAGLGNAYTDVLNQLSQSAARVIDKAPHNFMAIGLIHAVFPKARFIHLQRNPIDTCLSIYFQDFSSSFSFANDLDNLAHYYRQYQRVMTHWREVIPNSLFMDITYDALVTNQEAISRQIIAFLDLPWRDECLTFQNTPRAVKTASQWQVRQPMYKTSLERWRQYERHIGPLLSLV